MRKSFQYRIEANIQTIQHVESWINVCRNLYNVALEQRIDTYKHNGRSITEFDQAKQLSELRKAFPEYKEVDSQVLQDVLGRLDKAYKGFFRRVKNGDKPGFPRFKGVNRYNSFTLKKTSWKLDGKYLIIRNIGTFKIRLSRPIEGDIKTVTIRRSSTDKWYVTFSCDSVPMKPLLSTGRSVGIDVGCESFFTTSDGDKIENPRFFKKSQDKLRMRQQRLSCRTKGSNRRQKARILVAEAHEKVFNQRRDFHFKVANELIRNNDIICIEKMHAWNSGYRALTKSMRDVAWFGFFDILRFKAEEAGRKVVEVPAKDTSQLCSRCGARVTKDLSVRVHSCPCCGLNIDRDFNAALNILGSGRPFRSKSENLLVGSVKWI